MERKIRMGMVGGGQGAFIGAVHRMAAGLDGLIELVCGAFSSNPERSRASGADLFLPPERCYGTYQEMMAGEAALDPASGWTSSPSSRPTTCTSRSPGPRSKPAST